MTGIEPNPGQRQEIAHNTHPARQAGYYPKNHEKLLFSNVFWRLLRCWRIVVLRRYDSHLEYAFDRTNCLRQLKSLSLIWHFGRRWNAAQENPLIDLYGILLSAQD